jgi:hypothetical protein
MGYVCASLVRATSKKEFDPLLISVCLVFLIYVFASYVVLRSNRTADIRPEPCSRRSSNNGPRSYGHLGRKHSNFHLPFCIFRLTQLHMVTWGCAPIPPALKLTSITHGGPERSEAHTTLVLAFWRSFQMGELPISLQQQQHSLLSTCTGTV